ncbi:hypothetical protein TKK_0010614 [Trichogramma kaykai]|uniref:THAP-type domain-containing protein n=1 Tax=Trichogramma kaykai TaxID=54128 RepID=A0ABD2WWR2_9HYME
MYNQCCVPGCDSSTRFKTENLSFHSFPKLDRFIFVKTNLGNIKKISARKLWAKRLRLSADVANSWRVCSKHFKADDYLSSSLDKKVKRLKNIAIPSVELPEPSIARKAPLAKQKKNQARAAKAAARLSRVTPAILKKTQSVNVKETENKKEDQHNSDSEVNALFEEWIPDGEETYEQSVSAQIESNVDQVDQIPELISVGTQTECTCSENNTKNLTFQVKAAQLLVEMNEILGNGVEDKDVDNYMHNVILKVTEEFYSAARRYYRIVIFNLIKNDAQLRAFTGICFDTLGALAKSLVIDESERFPRIEISVEARIVLCLIKMKLNLSFKTLSYLFYITEQECKTAFLSSMTALKNVLKAAIFWPTINNISESLEDNLNDIYKPTSVVDNIELLVQVKPQCLNCERLVSESSIKKGNSLVGYSQAYGSMKKMKILLGFSASGLIRYVGRVFTGKAAGIVVTDQNQISKLLTVQKNAIMQNGILSIKNSTNNFLEFLTSSKNIKLPSENDISSKGKKTSKKVEKPLDVVIKKFRQFKIFQNEIPSEIVPYIDDISVIICGVINLSNSVIVDKTKTAQVN